MGRIEAEQSFREIGYLLPGDHGMGAFEKLAVDRANTTEITGDGQMICKQTRKRTTRPPVHFIVRRVF